MAEAPKIPPFQQAVIDALNRDKSPSGGIFPYLRTEQQALSPFARPDAEMRKTDPSNKDFWAFNRDHTLPQFLRQVAGLAPPFELAGGAAQMFMGQPVEGASRLAMALAPGPRLQRGKFDLDYFGQTVRVLQNPTDQQLRGFLNRTKYKAARRVTDPQTGNVFVWDAGDPALHKLIANDLGFEYDPRLADMIGLD